MDFSRLQDEEAMDFAATAPYLKDPLVLIGFALFLAFLFSRRLIASGIIPPVGAGRGAQIVRLLLHYGFTIGLLVVVLGFWLKHGELSEHEQQAAVALVRSELSHDAYVAGELRKNTETLLAAASAVRGVLRNERLKINFLLFPSSNADPHAPEDPDLYNKQFDALQRSGLLKDATELRRLREQNAAIVRSADRMASTLRSLGDQTGSRYLIHRTAYDANLPILRKVTIVDTGNLAEMYASAAEIREKYFRVAESTIEYFLAIRAYCANPLPDRAALGAALAAERLTMRLLVAESAELEKLNSRFEAEARRLEQ
jgi:hypothetical protein